MRIAAASDISGRRFCWRVAAAAVVFTALAVGGQAFAAIKDPQPSDRRVTMIVARALSEHLTRRPLNDEISRRTYVTFLRALDPMKVYFIQSDIDEFSKFEDQLDDMSKRGDVSFAFDVHQRLLKRIEERMPLVDELLKGDIDFTTDDEIVTDPKTTVYARTDAEVRDKWVKLMKYELLLNKIDKVEGQKARDKVAKKYHGIAKYRRQANAEDLLEVYLSALTRSYDPHTDYMSPNSAFTFESKMKLSYEGIGATLSYDYGSTKVQELVPGGAADKEGHLKNGDVIVGVGQGRGGEFVDVADMNSSDVVKLIRGKAGTVVRIKATPAAGGESKDIEITRASIELKDSEARSEIVELNSTEATAAVVEQGKKADGKPFKIGVIDLPSFYMDMNGARAGLQDFRSTSRDLRRILTDFTAKGVDSVVLDLRRNGGGSLTEAIRVTGLFIDEGPVVQVKDGSGRLQRLDDTESGVAWAGPLVVLQSKFSASASEIFAGAVQDYGRGIVVGDHTSHGKGLVQSVADINRTLFAGIENAPAMGAIKITIQQFYRPNGDSTQNHGVASDIELPSISSYLPVGESDLEYALAFDRVDPATFVRANSVDKPMIDELRTRSAHRIEQSTDFQQAEKKIARYKEFKERKVMSLNETKFLAERADLNADQEEEKQFEQMEDSKRPIVKRDYYFNEVLAIAVDQLQLIKRHGPSAVAGGQPGKSS